MKEFKSKISLLVLCLMTTLAVTISALAQTKENVNFKAGVAAIDANNMPLAYKKFLAAAKEGHSDSQFNLGVMYEQGIGTTKNEKEALIWYKKAAEKNGAFPQKNLGRIYEDKENYEEAFIWLEFNL